MAQRTITTLVDDLDGTDLEPGSGQTIRFGLDGRAYEIDLSDDNAQTLHEALGPYVMAARRIVSTRSGRRRR